MQTSPIQLTDVIYNATTQSFESVVAVHDNGQTYKYACAINAPITMSFDRAAQGLSTQARRRHKARGGLRSMRHPTQVGTRAGRPKVAAVRWLEVLLNRPISNAA